MQCYYYNHAEGMTATWTHPDKELWGKWISIPKYFSNVVRIIVPCQFEFIEKTLEIRALTSKFSSECEFLVYVLPVNQAKVQLKLVVWTMRSRTLCRHSCCCSWIDSQTFSSQGPLTILDPLPLFESRRSCKCAIHKIILSTWTLFIRVLPQIPDFSAKKTSKTPVKQNGPTEKSSGLPGRPQMKVRNAFNSSHAPEPRPASLVCLRCFEIYLEMLERFFFFFFVKTRALSFWQIN